MINRKKLEIVRMLFATGSNTIALLSALCGIYAIILKSTPQAGLLVAVTAYAFLTSCTRNFVKHPIPFLLLHVFPLVLIWGMMGTNPVNRIFGLTVCLGVCMYSFVKKIRRTEATYPIPIAISFGIFWVMYLVSRRAAGSGEEQVTFAYLALACFFGEWYLSRFARYLEKEERTNADIPERKLCWQGGMMAFAYSAFILLSVILFTSESLAERLGGWLVRGMKTVVLFLLSLLPRGGEDIAEEIVQESGGAAMLPELMGNESTEPFFLLVILEKILTIAAVIFVVALCVYGIYVVVHHFLGAFQKEKEQEDQVEDLRREEKLERLEKKKEIGQLRKFFGFRTPEEKIRRCYQKLVERTAKKEELEQVGRLSVREYLSQRMQPEGQQKDMENFAALYEKARYSGKSCSAGDSSEAASIARTLSGR